MFPLVGKGIFVYLFVHHTIRVAIVIDSTPPDSEIT